MVLPMERVRSNCMDYPTVEERLSHGETTRFIGGRKTFVMFANHHHDSRVGLWLAAEPGVQGLLTGGPLREFRRFVREQNGSGRRRRCSVARQEPGRPLFG